MKRFPPNNGLRIALCALLTLMLVSGEAAAKRHRHTARHRAATPVAEVAKPVVGLRTVLARGGADSAVENLSRWRTVSDESSNASFDDLDQFLRSNPNWPRQRTIQALAEKRMPATLGAREVQAWFAGKEPVTGIGMVRLGESEMALGNKAGAARIREAWLTKSFDRPTEQQVLADHGALLTPEVQDSRLAHLLYGSDEGAIRRQLARASAGAVQKATLRQALQKTPKKALAPLSDDPDVMFDAATALRQLGRSAEARRALLRVARSDDVPPLRLWSEIVLNARDALRAHAYQETYDLVSRHHLERGEEFADAEFLAGWIALKYLGKPDLALKHFQTLAKNVTRPISEARAEYWTGRALDALKKKDEARVHYEIAARKPYAFYGQLALARLGPHPVLRVPPQEPAAPTTLAKDGRVEAFRTLASTGARSLAREFALRIADDEGLTTAKAATLIKIANDSGDRALALKIAKHAEYQDVVVTDALHPMTIPGMPETSTALPRADLLALVRQESEFDPGAVSTAGARGLMQLMPAVAKQRAKALGMSYSPARLTSDASYNVKLGTTHFKAFFEAWRGSYVLAIASYNAGAGNVRKWIAMNGDPRDPAIDTVDWIESIPFAETRNYVQRVIENIEVYHARLAGGSGPLDILNTLNPAGWTAMARNTQPASVQPAESGPVFPSGLNAQPAERASTASTLLKPVDGARVRATAVRLIKPHAKNKAVAQNVVRKPRHHHHKSRRIIKVATE